MTTAQPETPKKEIGHHFLARLGKKRLRPGGIQATEWLLSQAGLRADSAVLEVACNRCTTSVELAERYQCRITALDMDARVLDRAREYVKSKQLEHLITIMQGNALRLPFPDQSFDVVINEAMLTMLQPAAKAKAIAEYYRVLKPGGLLLPRCAAAKMVRLPHRHKARFTKTAKRLIICPHVVRLAEIGEGEHQDAAGQTILRSVRRVFPPASHPLGRLYAEA